MRLEALLSEYLIHDQFRLAAQEAAQARHAAGRGFCSLHSWQYSQYASPLGVSAAYAKLAATTAAALEDAISANASGGLVTEFAARISELVAGPADCPACLTLAEGEQRALREIASSGSVTAATPLCLPHLVVVLQARPQAATAAAMTRVLATRLRRTSEDMRTYAAKREALQRSLITDEEASAYADALRLLAGQPALTQPWLGASSKSRS
jgi:hypothetical protein